MDVRDRFLVYGRVRNHKSLSLYELTELTEGTSTVTYVLYCTGTVGSEGAMRDFIVHRRGDSFLDCTRQVYNLGNGGVPVHHDPVAGIVTNHEK